MNNENQKSVGRRVRAAREEAGLSQGQLGAKVGYSAMGISHLENGNRKVKLEDLQKIAVALTVNISYLLEPVAKPAYTPTFWRRGDEEITDEQKTAEQEAMRKLDDLIKTMDD